MRIFGMLQQLISLRLSQVPIQLDKNACHQGIQWFGIQAFTANRIYVTGCKLLSLNWLVSWRDAAKFLCYPLKLEPCFNRGCAYHYGQWGALLHSKELKPQLIFLLLPAEFLEFQSSFLSFPKSHRWSSLVSWLDFLFHCHSTPLATQCMDCASYCTHSTE